MISVYDFKPRFQAMLRPMVVGLARGGVTPNMITIAALLLSAAAGAVIAFWPEQSRLLFIYPAVLVVRMALNALDGMLAREHDMTSRVGLFLNELSDVVSDAVLYLPLAFVPQLDSVLVTCFVVLAVTSEMAGVLGQIVSGTRRYDGPMGKSDRALLIGCIALLLALHVPLREIFYDIAIGVSILLLVVTIVRRCRSALRAESTS